MLKLFSSRWQLVKPNTIILHSRADDMVPLADSEGLVGNSELPSSALIDVGFEHRLADEGLLAAMVRACERRLKSNPLA